MKQTFTFAPTSEIAVYPYKEVSRVVIVEERRGTLVWIGDDRNVMLKAEIPFGAVYICGEHSC